MKGIPPGTEEGLLQQSVEKVAPSVKSVRVFRDEGLAVAVFDSVAVRKYISFYFFD
jgi:hypothetical protein